MTKLRIDFQTGILEVEGEETFVKMVYQDYKDKFTVISTPQEIPDKNKVKIQSQLTNDSSLDEGKKTTKLKNKTKESFSIVKDLDLSSKGGKQNLRDFYKEKSPVSAMENNAVFVYYLQKIAGVKNITPNHIYSCYKDVKVSVPTALRQSLKDTAHRKGWVDTASFEDIIIVTPGENFVEHDLPKAVVSSTK